jgi:hypothetical protein
MGEKILASAGEICAVELGFVIWLGTESVGQLVQSSN